MARHPIMNYRGQQELRIPDLMGGLNTRDSLSTVNDNQLTDSLNVWWKDGVLKTRPGLTDNGASIEIRGFDVKHKVKQTDIYIGQYRLCYCCISGSEKRMDNPEVTQVFNKTLFWLQGDNKMINLQEWHYYHVNFMYQKGEKVYCFAGNGINRIFKKDLYFKDNELVQTDWVEVAGSEIYVPTIYTHCLTDGIGESFEGVQLEGFNLLTSRVKVKYCNVNRKLLDASNAEDTHRAIYNIPFAGETSIFDYLSQKLIVRYTTASGSVVEHKVDKHEAQAKIWEESTVRSDGFRIQVYKNTDGSASLRFGKGEYGSGFSIYDFASTEYMEDNIEIEVETNRDTSAESKVFNMTECTWFGGSAAGLSGGSRLFLCGNTNANEKALVLWSGLNEPLYFSENCYAYVGNENQAVTCFGKQGQTLVMFKENGAGTYYTQYVKSDSITASDLINQSVIDYAASSVYFPITTIHPTIGCDCPNTVQLCRNRLVWTCSDGNVYTLSSQNQYSERNIYSLSEMIEQKLQKENNLQNAFSADWNGHYLLFTGNRVYVMDYESYGYAYIASHTKTENAQTKIPWWYWELNDSVAAVIQLTEQLFLGFYNDGYFGELAINELSVDSKDDCAATINTMLQTKLFDFSLPAYKKNVRLVNLSLGNNGAVPIKVELITEYGTEEQEIVLDSEYKETEIRTAGYLTSKAVYPCIRAFKRFGVKLSCEGEMAIDSLSINYTVLGGER